MNITERRQPAAPAYDLVLAVRIDAACALPRPCASHARRQDGAMRTNGTSDRRYSHYPTGSLFSDWQGIALPKLVAMASSRSFNVARQNGVSIVNFIAF